MDNCFVCTAACVKPGPGRIEFDSSMEPCWLWNARRRFGIWLRPRPLLEPACAEAWPAVRAATLSAFATNRSTLL